MCDKWLWTEVESQIRHIWKKYTTHALWNVCARSSETALLLSHSFCVCVNSCFVTYAIDFTRQDFLDRWKFITCVFIWFVLVSFNLQRKGKSSAPNWYQEWLNSMWIPSTTGVAKQPHTFFMPEENRLLTFWLWITRISDEFIVVTLKKDCR